MKIKNILLPFLLTLFSFDVSASSPGTSELEESVATAIEREVAPGFAAIVVRDGHLIHETFAGVESIETERPVTPDSLFRLGSTTKMFVALAALRLDSQGLLTLDDPISEWAPELDPAIGRLTLHQLLGHTAGLRDEAPMQGPLDENALASRVESWSSDQFFAEPDTIFSYSNPGYVLVSYVLEKVTGKPFPDLMGDLVLKPSGMTTATFRPLEAMTHPLAQPHQRSRAGLSIVRPFPENAANHAPGSLFASGSDLRDFLLHLTTERGAGDLERLTHSSSTVPALGSQYGYGLEIERVDGVRVLSHSGARLGYGSVITIAPDQRIAVAIVGNATGAILNDSAKSVIASLLELDENERTAETEYVDLSTEEAERIAGDYFNSDNVRTRISVSDEGITVLTPRGPVPARKTSDGRFHAPGAGPITWFRFVTGSDERTYLVAEMWATAKVQTTTRETRKR